jgi:hypothetical protein
VVIAFALVARDALFGVPLRGAEFASEAQGAPAKMMGLDEAVCDEMMGRIFAGEARTFARTVNKLGHGTYAGRRRSHDDIVLAVALAMWARAEVNLAKGMFAA